MPNNGKCVVCGSMLQRIDSFDGWEYLPNNDHIARHINMPRPKVYVDKTIYTVGICPSCGLLYGVKV